MSEENERRQRWQRIAIDQLGYTLNLVLTFAVAALGFCFVILKDRDFVPSSCGKGAMILALLLLTVSAASGGACTLNRLRDFRATARRASNNPEALSKGEVDEFGELTWILFYVHVWTFVTGVIALAVTLFLTYGGKLKIAI